MCLVYAVLAPVALACYLAYLCVAVPLGALAASVGYSVGLPGAYVVGLGDVLVFRTALPSPKRWPRPAAGDDPAVLGYFHGPAVADTFHAVRVSRDRCGGLWSYGWDLVTHLVDGGCEEGSPWLAVPLGLGAAFGMVIGGIIGAVPAAGLGLIHLGVASVSTAAVQVAGRMLRAVDSGLLRVKNIRMVCPHCFERVSYPAYACRGVGCDRRHRDIRPGRYGIVRRRCHCGAAMPTLLLLGASRLPAHCPYPGCGASLEYRPGTAPETVVPLFGATGAGKTTLLFGMVTQLRMWNVDRRLRVDFGDNVTARELNQAEGVLRSGPATTKTSVSLPRGHVVRVAARGRARVLHLFDAAGELFYHTDKAEDLRYLDKARTFVLVIDPLSVDAFWERLPAKRREALAELRSTAPSPELAYQQTHQQMEAMGVPLARARLAVVFSRADRYDAPGGSVAAWARDELGLGNLVRSVRQHFGEAAFFRTAAVVRNGVMDESVAGLLRWVLARDGITLPRGSARRNR